MNGCPYKASGNKICTHKGCKTNRNHKSICVYNNENNCPMYCEWLESKKIDEEPLTKPVRYLNNEMYDM